MEQNGSKNAQDIKYQETQEPLKDTAKEAAKEAAKLKEMEYRMLKNEELARINYRHTIIQLAFAGLGAIFAFSIQYKLSSVLLLYPFFMLWLALLWRQNTGMLARLRLYIATHLEGEEHQWERTLVAQFHPLWNYDMAFRLLFICSDLVALGMGIAQNPHDIVLIFVSAFSTLITAILLFMRLPMIAQAHQNMSGLQKEE